MTASDHRMAKRTIFEQWLQDFTSVSVIVDPKHVSGLPTHLHKETQISLEYGLNLSIPIDDLKISEVGIDGTLSFSRTPHAVFVPWDAVGAIFSSGGDVVVWPTDTPESFAISVPEVATPEPAFTGLRAVTDDDTVNQNAQNEIVTYTGPPKLRLVN